MHFLDCLIMRVNLLYILTLPTGGAVVTRSEIKTSWSYAPNMEGWAQKLRNEKGEEHPTDLQQREEGLLYKYKKLYVLSSARG